MSVRGPDPHNLRGMSKKTAPIIEVDRACGGCGYNLRGLRLGILCPECGMPSEMPAHSDDPLALMPLRVILALVRGCWVASACVGLMVVVLVAERFGAVNSQLAMVSLTGLSVIWVGAVMWLTPAFSLPQAINRGFSKNSRTRKAARWLQWGWVIALGCVATESLVNSPPAALSALLAFGKYAGLAIGLTGLVVLSILMERLAEWVRDEDAQKMFNWAMWSWPIAILLYAPVQIFIISWLNSGGRLRIGMGVFVIFWILAIGTFPYGLLTLAKSVTLSALHNIEYRERRQRREEREQQHHQRAGARAAQTEPQPMKYATKLKSRINADEHS